MARLAAMPSLRPASCCSVEVVNGALGDEEYSFSSTSVTQAEAHLGLGLAAFSENKPQAALEALRRAGVAGPYAIAVSAQLTAEVSLAIDDKQAALGYLRQALELQGYEVLTARNGKEALGLIDGQAPDAVLTDLFMPEMDGIETIGALRRRWPEIRVIAMSGRPGVDYLKVARELGVTHTLRKPFEIDDLLAALKA